MSLSRLSYKLRSAWRRRLMAGAVVLVMWGLLAWGLSPAQAGKLPAVGDTPTATATETATETATATQTQIPTLTTTPTGSLTVTATATTTASRTATVSATASVTPTITPTPFASMALVINEIAWSGTLADADAEWIELYNASPYTINLSGWELRSVNDFTGLNLVGSIPPGGYFLLAREGHGPFAVVTNTPTATKAGTATTTATPIAQPDLVIGQYFSGPISNVGGALELFAPDGVRIDSANLASVVNGNPGAWVAGNASTRCTMERRGVNVLDASTAWVTANLLGSNGRDTKQNQICGSPGKVNWAAMVTLTPSLTPSRTRTMTPTRTVTPQGGVSLTPTRTPNRTLPSSIVINEFLTQPKFDWNGDGEVNSGDEYIELINLSSQAVSISGWRLDDQDGDSAPFSIGAITMAPKVRMAFFTSETGILLSNGGDSVRLYKSGGQISDAFSYGLVQVSDKTWCRLPDGGSTWVFGCTPTVATANSLSGSTLIGHQPSSSICLSRVMPLEVLLAECNPLGLSSWNVNLWDVLSLKYPLFFDVDANLYILE